LKWTLFPHFFSLVCGQKDERKSRKNSEANKQKRALHQILRKWQRRQHETSSILEVAFRKSFERFIELDPFPEKSVKKIFLRNFLISILSHIFTLKQKSTYFSFWKLLPLKLEKIHIYFFNMMEKNLRSPQRHQNMLQTNLSFLKMNYSSVWGDNLKSLAQKIPESSTEIIKRKTSEKQFLINSSSQTIQKLRLENKCF